MYGERLEQELRDHLLAEIQEVEPSREWWNDAISRLGEQKRRSRWFGFMPKTRLAWALLPIILLLIGGTVYGASSIVRELFQKYATGVEEAGLAQELDLSQTIDGVTVKLERAYADSNIVLVGFTVSGTEARYYADAGELSTADGQSLPGMIGMGTVPGSDIILGNWRPSERVAMIVAFDTSSVKGMPSELSLRLETRVADSPIHGESQASMGPFRFDFNVPFHAGKIIDIGQTVEAKGVSVTLEQVTISPWVTRAVFKFQSYEDDYLPIVSLKLPNGDSENSSFGKDMEASSVQYFIGDFTGQHGEWTVVISELVLPSTGGEWTEVEVDGQKVFIGKASDTKRLSGPWIFHFQVPLALP